MGLLLDTHILIDLVDRRKQLPKAILRGIDLEVAAPVVSVATLWEIAIKTRLGKLTLPASLDEIPGLLDGLGFWLLPIRSEHVIYEVEPWPATNDPFDRLLLAQCGYEGLKLVTLDRILVDHPLAWRRGSA